MSVYSPKLTIFTARQHSRAQICWYDSHGRHVRLLHATLYENDANQNQEIFTDE